MIAFLFDRVVRTFALFGLDQSLDLAVWELAAWLLFAVLFGLVMGYAFGIERARSMWFGRRTNAYSRPYQYTDRTTHRRLVTARLDRNRQFFDC